jgi:uncharacterized protein YjbI with pentapeptide repeats
MFMRWKSSVLGLSLVLGACGGGDAPPPDFIPQFGVTERQLSQATQPDTGIVAQTGSGAVSLQLESSGARVPLPLSGDTDVAGVDTVFFQILQDGWVRLSLSDQDLLHVASVEVRNAAQNVLAKVDAQTPQAQVLLSRGDTSLPKPRFEIRVTSGHGKVSSPQVLIWWGDILVPTANKAQVRSLSRTQAIECESCNLSGTQLGGYTLQGSFLPSADLRNAWLVKVKSPSDLQLSEGQIFKMFMHSSQVEGANLSGANLNRADLTGALLTGAGDAPADLSGTHLNRATLTGVNLDRANLVGVQMNLAQAFQASFIGVDAKGAQFTQAQLAQTNFEGAKLHGANFSEADLRGSHLQDAQLTGTNLSGADLRGSNLQGAFIVGVGTMLDGAQLTGATWTDGRICGADSVGTCR